MHRLHGDVSPEILLSREQGAVWVAGCPCRRFWHSLAVESYCVNRLASVRTHTGERPVSYRGRIATSVQHQEIEQRWGDVVD